MGIVNIQGIGGVEFPDDMSPQDIQKAIETEILPKYPDVVAKGKRSFTQAATDIGGGLISGVGSLLQLPGQVGQLAGITEPEETPTGLQGVGKSVEEFGQGLKSPVLKAKEQVRSQRVAEAGKDGGFGGMAAEFGTAIKETITDPALITSFFAEQVPNLFGTMGGGLLARGGVKLLMADATKAALGKVGVESAVGKAGVAGAVGTGTIMQGADVGSDTYEQVFKRLVAEGTDSEEANRIALAQGRQAALQAAGISLGTAFLPGGRSIERALAGKGAPGVGGFARGFIGESGSEALEEGGGRFVSNVAQNEIFPDVSLTRGVGEAAGMGALGGGLFGGVAGGINARRDAQFEEQLRLAKDAEEAVQIAAEQERIAANDAANAEIKRRAFSEQGGITNSQAYADLTAEVDEAKAKLAKAEERRLAAQAKVDAKKAKGSAFTDAQPDLLGDVVSDQTRQTQQEGEDQSLFQQPLPGQLALPLSDQEGQLGLPGIGMAQPASTVEVPTPAESLIISRPLTKALGIPGGARNILNAIEGKDLTDPKQRAEVRDVLAKFADRTTKPGVAGNIEQFLNSPFFAEQGRLNLRRRPVSAKQRAAAMSAELEKAFAQMFAEAAKVKPKVPKLPHQRERKAGKLRDQELKALQAQQQIPVTETPPTQETQDVTAGQPTGGVPSTEPTVDGRAGEQGVGVAGVGAATTTQQTGATRGVQETGSGRLVDTAGGTESNVRGTAGAPAAVGGRTPTTLQQREAFGKALGAARPSRGSMRGRKNSALAKAIANGDIKGAIEALAQSKNKVIAEFARRLLGTNVRPNIVIDENAIELYNVRDETTQQVTIDSAKTTVELLDLLRSLKSKVEALPNDNSRVPNDIGDVKATEYDSLSPSGDTTKSVSSFINSKQLPVYIYVPENKFEISSKGKFLFYLNRLEEVVADIGEAKIRRNATATAQSIGVIGSYNPETNTIAVPEYFADNEDVIGHELVHAQVLDAIANPAPNQRTAVKRLETLFKYMQDYVAKNNDALYPYYKSGNEYGLTSIQEFAAEGISNPSFQFLLANVPYENTSAWGKFAKTIADMLGIKNGNAFTEFLNLYEAITNPNAPAAKQKAKVAPVTEPPTTAPKTESKAAPIAKQPTTAPIDKNLKGAARFEAEYLAEVNGDRDQMLRYLAADLYAKENMRRANPVYKALSAEEKANVDAQVESLKAQERRGVGFTSKMNAEQYQIRDYASGLKTPPEVLRVISGANTPALIAAAHRGSLARALNEIASNEKFSPLERAIARRLMENKMYSLPKLQVVPKEQLGEADGQYDPATDTISIADGAVDSHTVLHEAVHGYVHALIFKFENGEVTNPALADLQRLYNSLLTNNPELAEQYGMTSLTEFASEAMSNAQFQAALARIPYQNSNVFSKFAKMIMQLLGLGNTNNALAEAVISVERALNVGRGVQEKVSGTAEAPPSANVVRGNKAELESLFKAANGRDIAGKNANPVGSALNENTKANEAEAARTLTTMLDKFETGFLSFDAGLNNAIRRELDKDKRDWTTIKNIMTKISTAQALHSEALAMQFLEKGALRYDPTSYKFFAEDKPDSWKSMMALMSNVAKRNGLTDAELRNYANTAFIAERVEGLAKSKPEFYSHMTKEQVAAGKQLFDKIDGLRDVQKVWNGIRANAMDVAVENGLYNRKQADDLLQYMDFVPFYREEQLETGGGPRKYPNGFIDFAKNFKIKGSDQPVADVFGNMALWTTYTVSRAVRNRTAMNMYETAKEVMPDQVEDIRQDAVVKRSDNVVSFWEDGQRKKVKFADPLFVKAFEGMESVNIPLLKDVAKATNFLRQSIVLNPLFSISQLSQDSFAAMMTSGLKNPLQIPIEVVRQFFNILMGTNATGKYLSRAGVVGVNDYSSAVNNNDLAIATGLKPKSVFQKLLTPLEKFSMASDNAVRQALYNRTLLETGGVRQKDGSVKGGDEAAALEKAFEIINFKRSGSNGVVNVGKQLVPFFGAYLQAMNVTAKVLAGRGISPSERAAAYKTLMANTMMVATLGMLYAAINGGDDDYEKMDPQVRDKHLVIPGTGFMLPLRSDFTLFPKLIAEYAYMGITDNGFTDGKKVRRAMTEALGNAILSPTAVPQFIKPAVEVGINHNFFTGRDLVGKGVAGLDKEMQYTASTSELGKVLGKLGILAPIQIDHLIKGYAGSVGGLLLLGTNGVMASSDVPKPEKSTQDSLRQIPGLGTFFASEYGNAMKNDFYELRADVSKAVQTLNRLKTESPEKARAYMEENRPRLQLQTQVNAINNQLSKLRAYENQIRALPESRMDAVQKKEQIDRIRANEERMLKNVYRLREMAGY